MKNTFFFLSADVISNYADALELLSNVADLDDVESLDELKDALEHVEAYVDGVYAGWCDQAYRSEDDAVELLREDANAFEAALRGWLKLEDFPFIRNEWTDSEAYADRSSVRSVEAFLSSLRNDTL